jgi:glycosyltransferase involved in cell wall biosynthesis
MVLALFAICLKSLYKYRLVVDRHTNFDNFHLLKEEARQYLFGSLILRWVRYLFILISNFTLRQAELTIVTNRPLKALVEKKGGRAIVLPDKLPAIRMSHERYKRRTNIVTCISTFALDEPFQEVIQAATQLDPHIELYFTGNHKKLPIHILESAPSNIFFTGYLPDSDYFKLLRRSDIILVLTKNENCLLCGAYEAVALQRPLITSDTFALREYFYTGVEYVSAEPSSISKAINRIYKNYDTYLMNIKRLNGEIQLLWEKRFKSLATIINY